MKYVFVLSLYNALTEDFFSMCHYVGFLQIGSHICNKIPFVVYSNFLSTSTLHGIPQSHVSYRYGYDIVFIT